MNAIKMIKGVMDVKGVIADPAMYVSEARARMEIRLKILDALRMEKP